MARLVDSEKVYELGHRTPFHIGIADLCDLKELLADVPTVDAVPVVRCRDCKFGVTPYGDEHDGWIECSNIHTRPLFGCNDFCSYGERKEDGGNG